MNDTLSAYKYIIIGDEGVGKTSIAMRYTKDIFNDNKPSTIGVDFFNKKEPNIPVKINIWDTAGACRFNSIIKSFFRSSLGAIVVYDITSEKSFENVKKWIDDVKELTDTDTSIMLLGNKCESNERKVKTNIVREFAFSENIPFYEVSAKTGKNIKESFSYFNKFNYNKSIHTLNVITLKENISENINEKTSKEQCFC